METYGGLLDISKFSTQDELHFHREGSRRDPNDADLGVQPETELLDPFYAPLC